MGRDPFNLRTRSGAQGSVFGKALKERLRHKVDIITDCNRLESQFPSEGAVIDRTLQKKIRIGGVLLPTNPEQRAFTERLRIHQPWKAPQFPYRFSSLLPRRRV